MGRRRELLAGLLMVALLAGVAVLGLGGRFGSESEPAAQPAAVSPVGRESAGSVAQFADCGDWNGGSEAERRATVVELRGQLTGQTDPDAESLLSDERAYELFEHACAESYAQSLRLYKVYVRAAAFEPLRP